MRGCGDETVENEQDIVEMRQATVGVHILGVGPFGGCFCSSRKFAVHCDLLLLWHHIGTYFIVILFLFCATRGGRRQPGEGLGQISSSLMIYAMHC